MEERSKGARPPVGDRQRARSVEALRGVASKHGGDARVERGAKAAAARSVAPPGEPASSDELEDFRYLTAIFGASYIVARADGELSEEERRHLFAALAMLTGDRVSVESVENLIELSEQSLREVDFETAITSLVHAFKTRDDREVALTLALGTAAADGHVDESELATLGALARAFGIPPDRSKLIYQEVFLALAEARAAAAAEADAAADIAADAAR
ncbi:MAG TPA: TerB family tellurite resistance protein [Polyangiaceae bacterium]|nr:TerB family tellurite resistance protein [Polyangiaceae bacterium]